MMPKRKKAEPRREECGARSGPGIFYSSRTCVLDKGHGSSEHVDGRGLMWRDLQMGPKVPEWVQRRIKVKAVANGHIDLRSPGPTIDGVQMNWGDLFLAPRQHDSAANGVYIWVHRNTPVSPVDNQPVMGDEVEAAQGTCNAETRFIRANDNVFVQVAGSRLSEIRCGAVHPSDRDCICMLLAGHSGQHQANYTTKWWHSEPVCKQPHPRSPSTTCVLPLSHSGKHGTAMRNGEARGDVWSTEDHLPPQCPSAYGTTLVSPMPRCILPVGHAGSHLDRTDGSGWLWTTNLSYVRLPLETPRCPSLAPYNHLGGCVLPEGHDGSHGTRMDEQGRAMWDTWPNRETRPPGLRKIALAWHDTICPEGEDCRDRFLHSIGENLVTTGLLEKFLARMAEM